MVPLTMAAMAQGTLSLTTCITRGTVFLCVSVLHLYLVLCPCICDRPRGER